MDKLANREARTNDPEKINYVEFPAKSIKLAKGFFSTVFDWKFVDYGPEYTAFSNSGLNGGFYLSELQVSTKSGSAPRLIGSKKC